MAWQDLAIGLCNLAFGYALIPQIIYGFKTKRKTVTIQTSALTGFCLYISAFTFFTLKLYFAATMSTITGTLWAILLIQGKLYSKEIKRRKR